MIKKLELKKFKCFRDSTFEFNSEGVSILVGGNNAGKSTILHALAIWEFSKTYILFEKGEKALLEGYKGTGLGIGLEDFSPINLPSLKYLWTNLKSDPGYTLTIKCTWDTKVKQDQFLEIALALNLDRLFIKMNNSSVKAGDKIPNIAYLPPFAGISERETWYSKADRRRLIGKGLAGAVLRNVIVELFHEHQRRKNELQGDAKRLTSKKIDLLRATDPFSLLNQALFNIFKIHLHLFPFNPDFHNYIKVDIAKGEFRGRKFVKFKGYSKRDVMVEGSGFLQWLSVYAFALNRDIDVLLLDEPDAHLHCSLQVALLEELEFLVKASGKQALMASHSTEIVKRFPHEKIMQIANNKGKYLSKESQKIGLLAGLGTEYSPKLNKTLIHKNILFVENASDANILKTCCDILDKEWPKNLVVWDFAKNHKERRHLAVQLKDEISTEDGRRLTCLSIVDRDHSPYAETRTSLAENSFPDITEDLPGGVQHTLIRYRKWRRRYIENYLLCPATIARATGMSEEATNTYLLDNFGLVVPDNYCDSEVGPQTEGLFTYPAKDVFNKISEDYHIIKFDVLKAMNADEVPQDVITLVDEIIAMCQND